ncbi:MAG: MFS transporter [Candidatus Nitrosocaldaceae archaeon]
MRDPPNQAFRLILLLGLVSLTADMVYEGARSITGPYLLILGATAATIGLITGIGEMAAYGSRIIFGHIADKSGKYWTLMITGYMMILSLPILAFINRLDIASTLIVIERLGKSIRTPARDVIIANVASTIGRGKGFGIHEAMDQIGAITGPLIVAVLIYYKGYSDAFFYLLIPAIVTGLLLLYTKRITPLNLYINMLPKVSKVTTIRVFWLYLAFVSISVAGYAHFQLISYHIKFTSVMDDVQIPLLFAVAMGFDAFIAIIVGYLFDRKGLTVLILIPLTSIFVAPLTFSLDYRYIITGIILWGAVMGMHETIMRASIAVMIDRSRLATAYGLANGMYGASWLFGSILMGILYDISIVNVVTFSITLSIVSMLLLLVILKEVKSS